VKKGFEWPESRGFCGIRLVVREHDILALVDDFAYAVVSAKTLKEITSTPDDQE
jgi:hypothetical protein